MHELPKTAQQKIRKMLPDLMSLDFCRDIEAIVSEFGIENMKAWLPSAVHKRFRLLMV